MRKRIVRIVLIVIGALFIGDSIFALSRASANLGTVGPAIIGTPMLVYGIFFDAINAFTAAGFPRALKHLVFFAYIFVALIIIVSSVLMASACMKSEEGDTDAVVVLGAGLRGSRISYTFQNRLDAAFEYLEAHPGAVCVVTGGQGSGENMTEGSAAADYLKNRGIAEERIILEEESDSTVSNLENAKALLDARFEDGYSVAVVTSNFHLYRALINARDAGFSDVSGIPAHTPLYMLPNDVLRESAAIFRQIFV